MRKARFAGAAAFVMTLASLAQAQEGTGFELGARVGYGVPLGGAAGGPGTPGLGESDLNDIVSGQIPLWVDIGCRALPASGCMDSENDIQDKSLHEWVVLGVRGDFVLSD